MPARGSLLSPPVLDVLLQEAEQGWGGNVPQDVDDDDLDRHGQRPQS